MALLDACVLIRLYKCDALDLLARTIALAAAEHAHGEFAVGGPSTRAALDRLRVEKRPILPGSKEWNHFVRIRSEFSTVDLGEDQSIAVALAEAERDNHVPIVTYDEGATRKARSFGVATVSFLETLAWLVTCELITVEQASELEARAAARDGWRRPPAQAGALADLVEPLRGALEAALEVARSGGGKRR
ncbi:MAG TPA: hypothetical protein VK932_16530 [Kofleriaceae bacterium]|nr:hypothetical protein [Kofleriaceae bacterium]